MEQLTDYSSDGIDLTLIRWMLSMTPAERLNYHEAHMNSILDIWRRNGIKTYAQVAGGG